MLKTDLNSDLGESFGAYRLGLDGEILKNITSANIACGWHAGDPVVMEKTVGLAAEHGVAVGAHPGFPDLMGFGRREMKLSPEEIRAYVLYQLGALGAFARAAGTELQHVKPHGALYNMAVRDMSVAAAVCAAARAYSRELIVLAPAKSRMEEAAEEAGLRFVGEFFADRAYNPDGTLVSRSLSGAVIEDSAAVGARVMQMVREGTVTCIDGTVMPINCGSICVHGDNAHGVEITALLRRLLEDGGVKICAMRELL